MPTIPTQALCLTCSAVSRAVFEHRTDGVYLVRDCESCGVTEARVSKDVTFFTSVAKAANEARSPIRGLIVELLDGCNIKCPTCIAGSTPSGGNARSAELLKKRIGHVVASQAPRALLMSGGEPTIHPDFIQLASFTAAQPVAARILITNGLRFANEPEFLKEFTYAGGTEMEVFLQWDSLRPHALLDLRGHDYTAERVAALEGLANVGITVTLVNVVKRGVTLQHVDEVLATARDFPNVVGLQFQPIRDAGRVLNFRWEENSCEVTDIFEMLPGRVQLAPCPSSPWSTFVGWMSRSSGEITTGDVKDEFYISPTNATPSDSIRVAVLDYSDRYNWTSDRSRLAALQVLDEHGGTLTVDDYFLNITPESAVRPAAS